MPKTPSQKRCVKLAATAFGPPLPNLQAYHTSIVVADMEFAFSSKGIEARNGIQSHNAFRDNPTITELGFTSMSRTAMVQTLRPYFLPGSYDLLRKNCNSFTDCALFYLTGKRLDQKYRALEKIGALMDSYGGAISALSGGKYKPNPQADTFQSCKVVALIKKPEKAERAEERPQGG
eukprot:CAMPEP_0179060558 /NCGR_PEP_ID=MMETSP0796-20121207/25928_1 /TAXON_ID=73915 /ORGANISM="Pyrodinium bahamense, Strain pbaha01" /LENGTH=176 /DNA_ID=CAMNT_0020757345 /DNA_START=118 /DNA_END=648 /DNA_ORIENTATION=+